ncbi:MAG: hypothetical protein IPK29_07680 [Betaproteobacteria bacterium]|nr:hypothetical protein [Betaproteobacteria bacterium]
MAAQRAAAACLKPAEASDSSASTSCSRMRPESPCRRDCAGKLHIGIACLTVSMSMCAHQAGMRRHVARDPGHVGVDHQAEVGLRQELIDAEPGEAGELAADVGDRRVLEHAHARQARDRAWTVFEVRGFCPP